MIVGEKLEVLIVLGTILFSLFILTLIDRLGTLRRDERDDEEEY
jgi:hypothetical protein